jgi:hypothetical protein
MKDKIGQKTGVNIKLDFVLHDSMEPWGTKATNGRKT